MKETEKQEAIEGLKQMVESIRGQAEALGMADVIRKLDAALLLEDEVKTEHYANEMLIQLRAALVQQIAAIDEVINR